MKRHIKILICFLLLSMPLLASASDAKIYVADEDVNIKCGKIYVQSGNHFCSWLEIDSIQSDAYGVFIRDSHVIRDKNNDYIWYWRCWMCDGFSPRGKPCQTTDCPSKG